MKVYEMTLARHSDKYYLTEKVALPIMRKFENREIGTIMIPEYGIMFDASLIREIKAKEIKPPYPKQLKQMLQKEGKLSLPPKLDSEAERIRKLPTKGVFLEMDRKTVIDMNEGQLNRAWRSGNDKYKSYYFAEVHQYKSKYGDTALYLNPEYIPLLIRFEFDDENPEYSARVMEKWVYGRKQSLTGEDV